MVALIFVSAYYFPLAKQSNTRKIKTALNKTLKSNNFGQKKFYAGSDLQNGPISGKGWYLNGKQDGLTNISLL